MIDILPEQKKLMAEKKYGGTMRLGAYPAVLAKGSIAETAYGKTKISERHRHRYEVNPAFIKRLEKAGMVFSGQSPDRRLMEVMELPARKPSVLCGLAVPSRAQVPPALAASAFPRVHEGRREAEALMFIFLYGPDDYRRLKKKNGIIAEFGKKHSGLGLGRCFRASRAPQMHSLNS